jgi:hypothetical protein
VNCTQRNNQTLTTIIFFTVQWALQGLKKNSTGEFVSERRNDQLDLKQPVHLHEVQTWNQTSTAETENDHDVIISLQHFCTETTNGKCCYDVIISIQPPTSILHRKHKWKIIMMS